MFSVDNKPKHHELVKHPTKRKVFVKFIAVVLVFAGYFLFVAGRLGFENGFYVTTLTWSFFVLSTPIADAGFLVDFPLRLLLGVRMIVSESIVWLMAITANVLALGFKPELYSSTDLLEVFKKILETPWPYWSIIALSAVGTFMSVIFGDELIDKVQHKDRKIYKKHKFKYRVVVMVFIIVAAIVLYDVLLKQLGYNLPG